MTARMRGNMTVNAGEFSTFLKELVNTGYIKISTGPGTWEKDIFNEDAKETMQEKINRMLVTEASRQEM